MYHIIYFSPLLFGSGIGKEGRRKMRETFPQGKKETVAEWKEEEEADAKELSESFFPSLSLFLFLSLYRKLNE